MHMKKEHDDTSRYRHADTVFYPNGGFYKTAALLHKRKNSLSGDGFFSFPSPGRIFGHINFYAILFPFS